MADEAKIKEELDEIIPEGIKDLGTEEEVDKVEEVVAEGIDAVADEVEEVEGEAKKEFAEIGGAKIFTSIDEMLKNITRREDRE